jgi:transcription initiation factor TFIIF subunit beta
MVAHLVKAGDFAMTWELKPEAQHANYASMSYDNVKDEKPPDMDDYDDASEEDPTASGMITDHD